MKRKGIALLLLSFVFLLGVVVNVSAHEPDSVFQVSVIGAISGGVYDGAMNLGDLAKHGDFGLGATHELAGELVVVDGKFYQFGVDGRARLLLADDTVTFAAVTFFEPEISLEIDGVLSQEDLEAQLLDLIENKNIIHAISVTGRFAHIKARTPARQTKPYRPLAEVLAEQAEHDFYDVTGTMVGFWTPDYLASVHSPGFHFHFVVDEGQANADGAQGGHVLTYEIEGAHLSIDAKDQLEIWFPTDDPEFQNLEL